MLVCNWDCQVVYLQEVLVIATGGKCLDCIRICLFGIVHAGENYILKGNCTKDYTYRRFKLSSSTLHTCIANTNII